MNCFKKMYQFFFKTKTQPIMKTHETPTNTSLIITNMITPTYNANSSTC